LDDPEVVEDREEGTHEHDDREHAEGEGRADVEQGAEEEAGACLREPEQAHDRAVDGHEEGAADVGA
jgi:hypothetical protein